MSDFAQRANEYLQLRRALGFKLNHHGRTLRQFVAYLDAVGASTLTVDDAVAWAALPQGVQPVWLSQRLGVVRGFARYMQAFDPATEVPPVGIWRPDTRRPVPHLYFHDELRRLLAAARELKPELRAASHETLLGLLSVSGMRVGEALSLSRDDVDLAQGIVTVRRGKFNRSRLIPLHPSATSALHEYAENRDRLCPRPRTDAFFLSNTGTRLSYGTVRLTFHQLALATGLRSDTAWPRIHDYADLRVMPTGDVLELDWRRRSRYNVGTPRVRPPAPVSPRSGKRIHTPWMRGRRGVERLDLPVTEDLDQQTRIMPTDWLSTNSTGTPSRHNP